VHFALPAARIFLASGNLYVQNGFNILVVQGFIQLLGLAENLDAYFWQSALEMGPRGAKPTP
jgi:hypothetical protein